MKKFFMFSFILFIFWGCTERTEIIYSSYTSKKLYAIAVLPTEDNIKDLEPIDISSIVYREMGNTSQFAFLEEKSFKENVKSLNLNLSKVYENDTRAYKIIRDNIGASYLLITKIINKKVEINNSNFLYMKIKKLNAKITIKGKIVDLKNNDVLIELEESAFVKKDQYGFTFSKEKDLSAMKNDLCKEAAKIAAINLARNLIKKL